MLSMRFTLGYHPPMDDIIMASSIFCIQFQSKPEEFWMLAVLDFKKKVKLKKMLVTLDGFYSKVWILQIRKAKLWSFSLYLGPGPVVSDCSHQERGSMNCIFKSWVQIIHIFAAFLLTMLPIPQQSKGSFLMFLCDSWHRCFFAKQLQWISKKVTKKLSYVEIAWVVIKVYKVYLDYLTLKEGNNWLFNRLLCSDLSVSADCELYITLKNEEVLHTKT